MKGSSDVSKTEGFDHLAFVQKQLMEEGLSEEWEAIIPKDNELFIDLDSPEQEDTFGHSLEILQEHWPAITYTITPSKGGKKHVILDMHEPLSYVWRVALQACLGSDPKREILHLVSYKKKELNPIVLVERKQEVCLNTKQ